MRIALDTSILVGFFIESDKIHKRCLQIIDQILKGEIEYACTNKINIIEMAYIIERLTNDQIFSNQCILSIFKDFQLDIIDINWDFMIIQSHLKAINTISFCDNATLTTAKLTNAQALFSKEKEIVVLQAEKGIREAPEILFIENLNFKKSKDL